MYPRHSIGLAYMLINIPFQQPQCMANMAHGVSGVCSSILSYLAALTPECNGFDCIVIIQEHETVCHINTQAECWTSCWMFGGFHLVKALRTSCLIPRDFPQCHSTHSMSNRRPAPNGSAERFGGNGSGRLPAVKSPTTPVPWTSNPYTSVFIPDPTGSV